VRREVEASGAGQEEMSVGSGFWKLTKAKALRGKHYNDFTLFRQAIDNCLDRVNTDYADQMKSFMTLNFQTFEETSLLAA